MTGRAPTTPRQNKGERQMGKQSWFEVDKEGLAQLVARRGKVFVVQELLQNAWDCGKVTDVSVVLEPVAGRPLARLVVEDDDPDGFKNLAHAYTLFAPSEKKGDATRRGRFNLGEKLVLSLCDYANITSTKGSVYFDAEGRHTGRQKTTSGTRFMADIRMTREELEDVLVSLDKLIPPVRTRINGKVLATRKPAKKISDVMLYTDVADAEGFVRRKMRTTAVEVYVLRQGEKAALYEMGIPVMELGDDPYHVNVLQKLPLGMERDAVSASYLKDIRGAVLDAMYAVISEDQARGKWASDGIEEATNKDAVRAVVTKRFGERAVTYDPSDREANNIATAKGYTVITGGSFTSDAWDKIRDAGVALPAGQVTPSPKPFHPGGEPLELIPPGECTPGMVAYAALVVELAAVLEKLDVTVCFTGDKSWRFAAAYSKTGDVTGVMTVNAGSLGAGWFQPANLSEQLRLFVHEVGHHFGHHLEESYHESLCRIAGKLAVLALHRRDIFGVE